MAKWKNLIVEIKKVEAKYGSVVNVPYTDKKAMVPIYEITNLDKLIVDEDKICKLTEIQYNTLRKLMRKEIRKADVVRILNKSRPWMEPRVEAIEEGRYTII
ncbi:hypothetical protein [Dellaglioa sp. BT-FLS60]